MAWYTFFHLSRGPTVAGGEPKMSVSCLHRGKSSNFSFVTAPRWAVETGQGVVKLCEEGCDQGEYHEERMVEHGLYFSAVAMGLVSRSGLPIRIEFRARRPGCHHMAGLQLPLAKSARSDPELFEAARSVPGCCQTIYST